MKRLFQILSLGLMISLVACNQSGEKSTSESKSTEKEQAVAENTSETGDIKPIHLTAEEFRQQVWDYESSPQQWVYQGDIPCVVDFYADWCQPCKRVAPIMDDLADYYDGRVKIYKVNTDDERELATVFQVRSIPSILFAPMEGKPAMQPGALSKEDYIRIIDDYVLKLNKTDNDKTES